MIYLLNFIILLIFSAFEVFSKKFRKNDKFLLSFLFIIYLAIFTGFADLTVGRDKSNFYRIFKNLELGSNYIEFGWGIIVPIIKEITSEIFLIFFLLSLVALLIKYEAFKRLTPYYVIAFLGYYSMFYYYYDLEALRQNLAISITLYSIIYIIKDEFIKYIFFVLLAFQFHASSLIFVPAYFLSKFKINKKIMAVGLLIAYKIGQNLNYLTIIAEKLYFISPRLTIRINDYLNSHYFRDFSLSKNEYLKVVILIVFVILKNQIKLTEKKYNLYINLYYIYVILIITFNRLEIFITRGAIYYRIVECILFSYLFTIKNKKIKFFIFCLILIYFLTFNVKHIFSSGNKLLPYVNYLLK